MHLPQAAMLHLYRSVSPGVLLLMGWLLVVLAMAWRTWRGLDIPSINGLFILVGLGAYFLPPRVGEPERGEALRRKLLWVLLGAGAVILCGEVIRTFLAPESA